MQSHLGHATHVLDRFHVIRWFAAGLQAVRRDVQRRQPAGEVIPAFDPDVFRARFALMRRADNLSDGDRARLDELFDRHPRLRAGWVALQTLHGAYLAEDRQGALGAIIAFVDLYETGQIPEFATVVKAIVDWGDEIIAFHHPRARHMSNGRIEGTNNKLQVLRRVAHGFTNRANFEARGILACGPVPRSRAPSSTGTTP